ncbi:ABC transporter ATP-binding protein [Curtobacterium sp. MCPF17_031]|uniref:ABC transporter ATP-binding protein n=1 Tax=Curtobacterium sp. MCPF17_031 TaxID=2175653 RepID=UPI000DA912BD|nr:ABC transporter ATP-binding protein [Curtobacterium sp. MCPF17_031]PZE39654.1 Fe(3+)-dicitrate ABC transporter ATP-binding protein [Curtobacterium sp. MCPF17_031]
MSPAGRPATVLTPEAPVTALGARGLRLGYDDRVVVQDLDVDVPDGELTVIVGPNACGKSTLLKALARTLKPSAGTVYLDGRPITSYRPKAVARRVAMLPQTPIAPDGITVRDLVARGRFPHQDLLHPSSGTDRQVVQAALAQTDILGLADRGVDELSGGQRQRVWIAMVLAQQTDIVLLDEPTTFLDIAHQYDVLELASTLHAAGRTVVAVLHDLNQAARYATHMIAMRDGAIVAQGTPASVVTEELVADVFGLPCVVVPDPETGTPLVVPRRVR